LILIKFLLFFYGHVFPLRVFECLFAISTDVVKYDEYEDYDSNGVATVLVAEILGHVSTIKRSCYLPTAQERVKNT